MKIRTKIAAAAVAAVSVGAVGLALAGPATAAPSNTARPSSSAVPATQRGGMPQQGQGLTALTAGHAGSGPTASTNSAPGKAGRVIHLRTDRSRKDEDLRGRADMSRHDSDKDHLRADKDQVRRDKDQVRRDKDQVRSDKDRVHTTTDRRADRARDRGPTSESMSTRTTTR